LIVTYAVTIGVPRDAICVSTRVITRTEVYGVARAIVVAVVIGVGGAWVNVITYGVIIGVPGRVVSITEVTHVPDVILVCVFLPSIWSVHAVIVVVGHPIIVDISQADRRLSTTLEARLDRT
jgi:hypothetical protein